MRRAVVSVFSSLVVERPRLVLALVAVLVGLLAIGAPDFALDTSSDSLLLESDQEIRYYRAVRSEYGSDDFLVLTFTPAGDLFSDTSLRTLQSLRTELAGLQSIASVVSILDVPLLKSPPISPKELADGAPTLLSERTDRDLARREILESPLYRNLIISPDGRTTALQINLDEDDEYLSLLERRSELWERRRDGALTEADSAELERVENGVRERRSREQRRLRHVLASVRAVAADYEDRAELHLGGLPMISADLIDFIRRDLIVFGIGLAIALTLLLFIIFRRLRWVALPLMSCSAAVVCMIGFLGLVQWPVTVVSSNFISLMLILTLSLNVHVAVRFRELHAARPSAPQRALVVETVRNKFYPALYTALTTMVAFGSLLVSDIRPVIDFGWMMVIGMSIAFVLTFLMLPATLTLLHPSSPQEPGRWTDSITGAFARLVKSAPRVTLATYALIAIAACAGLTMLSVDNRFIDYFKKTTAIYQGMQVIDARLGGTTPLDVVLDADPDFIESQEWERREAEELDLPGEAGLAATSYWYNTARIGPVEQTGEELASRRDIGKVLSLATTMEVIRGFLGEGEELDNFELSVIHRRLPEEVKAVLFEPYLSDDGYQTRIAARVYETSATLERNELLESIRSHLVTELGMPEERVHVTGLMVLYNNVLQSLFGSQVTTAGVVLLAIMIMFWVSFRSLRIAAVAMVPNVIGAAVVLGLMGAFGVPLDIMTITIAAITIGIGVDDTIHYVYRFREEFEQDRDYAAAIDNCHHSIGHAMYYTSITIILGFSILALSNFVPTIYFGLLTGLAMTVALVANLTLLPLLLARLQVLGPEH